MDALEHELNAAADAGYRFAGVVPVRSPDDTSWTHTVVLERDDD